MACPSARLDVPPLTVQLPPLQQKLTWGTLNASTVIRLNNQTNTVRMPCKIGQNPIQMMLMNCPITPTPNASNRPTNTLITVVPMPPKMSLNTPTTKSISDWIGFMPSPKRPTVRLKRSMANESNTEVKILATSTNSRPNS